MNTQEIKEYCNRMARLWRKSKYRALENKNEFDAKYCEAKETSYQDILNKLK